MKRYEEIENMILSRDLTDEEVMILNEATLMKNVVEFQKNKVKNQHDTVVIPLMKDGKVIRRMGIYDKEKYTSTDVDVKIMQGEVYDENFLILPVESQGAKLFENEPKKPKVEEQEEQTGEYDENYDV